MTPSPASTDTSPIETASAPDGQPTTTQVDGNKPEINEAPSNAGVQPLQSAPSNGTGWHPPRGYGHI